MYAARVRNKRVARVVYVFSKLLSLCCHCGTAAVLLLLLLLLLGLVYFYFYTLYIFYRQLPGDTAGVTTVQLFDFAL